MALAAGRLRHRVTFQTFTTVTDAGGGETKDWVDGDTVWAAIEPLSGSERIEAMQVSPSLSHRIRIRHRDGITAAVRLQHDGRTFDITAVFDPDGRRAELEILAEEKL